MSRPPKDEAHNSSTVTSALGSSAPPAEPKAGKKRKRKTRAAPDVARDGAFVKKGVGQRIKFDDGDEVGDVEELQEKEHVVLPKEVEVRRGSRLMHRSRSLRSWLLYRTRMEWSRIRIVRDH
jgi:hypothetical protein